MAVVPTKRPRWRWLLHCAAVCVVFVLAASPVLILNTIQFRSPFKTGYDFWASYLSAQHLFFSLLYVPDNAAMLWRQSTLQPHGYDAAYIFGTGTSFVPAFVLLSCAGLLLIRRSWFVYCAFLSGLSSFVATLCYLFGTDGRLYLPLLILVVAIAVLPITWAANNLFAGKRIIAGLITCVLFAATCLGYPSRSGYNTHGVNRLQAWDALHFTTPPGQSTQFVAQRDFARVLSRQPGIVLSEIDPVYLNALLPPSFVAAPIDGKHHYKWSYAWRYHRPQAAALVEHGLQRSFPIYALFTSQDEVATNQSRLPKVFGYEWRILKSAERSAAILKLAPVASNEPLPPD